MTLLLKAPSRSLENFAEPINYLISQIATVNSEAAQKIVFDFNESRFISPFYFGGLASFIFSLKAKGCEVEVLCDKNEMLQSYLNTICFPEGFLYMNIEPDIYTSSLMRFTQKNYIPILCFPTSKNDSGVKAREKIISTVNSIFKQQLGLQGELLQAIYYLVDELTQNIADHSECEQGLIFAQFYPSRNYMDLCIADYGKGLFRSYIESGKHAPKDHAEALNFAVFGKSTKDLPESRGFGISTSRKMLVNGLRGKFFIMSGDAFFSQTYEKQNLVTVANQYRFEGCYVALRIPVQNVQGFDFYRFVE